MMTLLSVFESRSSFTTTARDVVTTYTAKRRGNSTDYHLDPYNKTLAQCHLF